MDTIDLWMDSAGKGRENLNPDKIPWEALKRLLSQSIYGGRIDNAFDQQLLDSFIDRMFTAKAFDSGFKLVDADSETVEIPDGSKKAHFVEWAKNTLPNKQSPAWLGLPQNAENVMLALLGKQNTAQLMKLQTMFDDEGSDEMVGDGQDSSKPAWMRSLHAQASKWLEMIPKGLELLTRTPEKIKDPLFRFFDREIGSGHKLLKCVRQDLTDAIGVCAGELKQTNHLRDLLNDLQKGVVCGLWSKVYTVPAATTVNEWIPDFAKRVEQLAAISKVAERGEDLSKVRVWMGGLFTPEAFFTASRQAVAQRFKWSLETLSLEVDVRKNENDPPAPDAQLFLLKDLRIEGAICSGDTLALSSEMQTRLPLTAIKWVKSMKSMNCVTLPIYLNGARSELIQTCSLRAPQGLSDTTFYERGVAFLASGLS
jgi:dynein heavy chain 1